MDVVIVRYKTKVDRGAENQALIETVFADLHVEQPKGLRYASFRLADEVSFVHVAAIETDDGANPLTSLSSFGTLLSEIGDRCDEAPAAQPAKVVGSYNFFEQR